MRPYEVFIYHVEDNDEVASWGPEIVFAKTEKAAEHKFLLMSAYNGDIAGIDIDELVVLTRPFADI